MLPLQLNLGLCRRLRNLTAGTAGWRQTPRKGLKVSGWRLSKEATNDDGYGPDTQQGARRRGPLRPWSSELNTTKQQMKKNFQTDGSITPVWWSETDWRGDGEEEDQPETQDSDDGAWPWPLSLQRSWDIQLFLGDLPSAAFSFQGSAVFSSGPVSPLGSLKLSGSSTPTPTFLPPPLPQLLQTLPEVCLPGDPGLPLLLLCGERICCFLVDRNRFNFQGSELIRIYKNNRMNADVGVRRLEEEEPDRSISNLPRGIKIKTTVSYFLLEW